MQDDLSPAAMPFDRYQREHADAPLQSRTVLHCLAMAKRMLLQEKVRDFTAADVVALAALIESRDRAAGGK